MTDRDLALSVIADGRDFGDHVADHASSPVITARARMDVEEAAELMVRHGVRRLVVVDGERLTGSSRSTTSRSRTGDAGLAQQLSARVTRAVMPDFFFHERGERLSRRRPRAAPRIGRGRAVTRTIAAGLPHVTAGCGRQTARYGRRRPRRRRVPAEDDPSLGGISARKALLLLAAAALLLGLGRAARAGLRRPARRRGSASRNGDMRWLTLALVFEVLSFLGHIVLFRAVAEDGGSGRIGLWASTQINLAGHAATRLFASAGAGGIALTAWAMRRSGMERADVAARMVTFLVLLYGVYMGALVVGGLGLYTGLLPGGGSFAITRRARDLRRRRDRAPSPPPSGSRPARAACRARDGAGRPRRARRPRACCAPATPACSAR